MAPTPYQPGFSYSDWEQDNPTQPKPGAELDSDFANIGQSVNETIDALADVRRSDGALNNGIVTLDSLSADVRAVLGESNDLDIISQNIGSIITVADDLNGTNATTTVAANIVDVNTVSASIGNVNIVAADLDGDDNIGTVAGEIANVVTVGENIEDVNRYANTYLPPASSDPATRPDGSPLQIGDLYYNTSAQMMEVYGGAAFVPVATASLGGLSTGSGVFGPTPDGEVNVGFFTTLFVWLNGLLLVEDDDYTQDGSSFTVLSPTEGDEWQYWAYQANDATDYYTKFEVNGLLEDERTETTDLYGGRIYDTVAEGLASTEGPRGVGEIWEMGGFRYEEAAIDADEFSASTPLGYHVETAGDVKLKVIPDAGGYCWDAFGAVGDWTTGLTGTDNASALKRAMEVAFAYCSKSYGLAGAYLTSPFVVETPSTSAIPYADPEQHVVGGVFNTVDMRRRGCATKIIFNVPRTDTTGKVGIAFQTKKTKVNDIMFACYDMVSGSTSAGDFIGFTSDGIGSSCERCAFYRMPVGHQYRDLGYAHMVDIVYWECDVGLRHTLDVWSHGTTCRFNRVMGFICDIVIDATGLTWSTFEKMIVEYNRIGIYNFGIRNTFKDNYGELNTEYSAYSNVAGATLFSGNRAWGAGDAWIGTGTTGSFGNNVLGSTYADWNRVAARQFEFYNFQGNPLRKLAARGGAELLQEYTMDDVELGAVAKIKSSRANNVKQDQIFTFYVKGTSVIGLPDGWTCTRASAGLWQLLWGGATDGNIISSFAPGIIVTPMHTAGGVSIKYDVFVYPRDVGGNWSGNNTMTGFTFQIEQGGLAADGACSIVVIG